MRPRRRTRHRCLLGALPQVLALVSWRRPASRPLRSGRRVGSRRCLVVHDDADVRCSEPDSSRATALLRGRLSWPAPSPVPFVLLVRTAAQPIVGKVELDQIEGLFLVEHDRLRHAAIAHHVLELGRRCACNRCSWPASTASRDNSVAPPGSAHARRARTFFADVVEKARKRRNARVNTGRAPEGRNVGLVGQLRVVAVAAISASAVDRTPVEAVVDYTYRGSGAAAAWQRRD